MQIADRIRYIIDYYKINAAEFADKLNVQRSNISHLLTGRNKPSLDFLTKVAKSYPDLNIKWLITGEGNFKTSDSVINKQGFKAEDITKLKDKEQNDLNMNKTDFIHTNLPINEEGNKVSRKVTKVILIYNDNSFDVY